MISSILIDGVLKLVQVCRYGKKSSRPDVVRLLDPKSPIPEKILVCNKYNPEIFFDEDNGNEYKMTQRGLIPIN